jgi:hypothetical protein
MAGERIMLYVNCSQCGARCPDGLGVQIRGKYRNLCPRCAAAHREKKNAEARRQDFQAFIRLLALFLLVVGALVWFLFFAN